MDNYPYLVLGQHGWHPLPNLLPGEIMDYVKTIVVIKDYRYIGDIETGEYFDKIVKGNFVIPRYVLGDGDIYSVENLITDNYTFEIVDLTKLNFKDVKTMYKEIWGM